MTQEISFQIDLKDSYAAAIEKVTAALKEEGFGVLTRIDVDTTLKEKIDVDFRQYVILGACNPPLAHRALSAEPKVGLMLPCNVTVEATDGGARVNILNPDAMLSIEPLNANAAILEVAAEAKAKLARVAAALQA
ncbi:MAG: DUF302 domain-containing protein [Anaerolineae bacterium]|nr:DUF302 domain-containing protein [Anaerolineae bacterium]